MGSEILCDLGAGVPSRAEKDDVVHEEEVGFGANVGQPLSGGGPIPLYVQKLNLVLRAGTYQPTPAVDDGDMDQVVGRSDEVLVRPASVSA